MFIDLYFPLGLEMDRDDIQTAIEAALGADVEIVGGGVGPLGTNLDLEVSDALDRVTALQAIERTLTSLGVSDATSIQVSDTRERFSLRDLRSRLGGAGTQPRQTGDIPERW